MATTVRPSNPDLTAQNDAALQVSSTPWKYDFFQALRILQRSHSTPKRLGYFGSPLRELMRIGVAASLSFPASELQSWEESESLRPTLRVNFFGLTGPLGVLPHPYTELVMERLRARDTTLRDFLDLFHHRILSFFYRAWEKHHISAELERAAEDDFSGHLYQLIGLGTPGLRNRLPVPDQALLFYSGLLATRTRSAVGLEQILADYFGIPVEVEQFAGTWEQVDTEFQCCLDGDSDSVPLGDGVLIGNEVWEQQGRFRILLGPLTLEQYRNFLPGGDTLRELKSLVEFYTGPELEMVLQLILKREETPNCELVTPTDVGVQLGWTTWLKTSAMTRDPRDTVLDENLLRLN
jgi:type VI secretion system protein ImpH